MPGMRGLTILVACDDAARFEAALALAAAQAALGCSARVHLHERAVGLLASPPAMLAEALALGVRFSVCQAGLAEAGLSHGELHEGIEASGLIALLTSLGEDRLVTL